MEKIYLGDRKVILPYIPRKGYYFSDLEKALAEDCDFVAINETGVQISGKLPKDANSKMKKIAKLELAEGRKGFVFSVVRSQMIGLFFWAKGTQELIELVDPGVRKNFVVVEGNLI